MTPSRPMNGFATTSLPSMTSSGSADSARGDGPSEFYLQQIAAASQRHFDSWDGTVTLEAK